MKSNDTGQAFNPEMLTLRRESRGLTQSQLAKEAGISQAKLSLIEGGGRHPSDEELASLAERLQRPVTFFLQSDRIYGPGVSEFYHRRNRSVGARDLKKAHAAINEDIISIRRLLKSAEIDTSQFDSISDLTSTSDFDIEETAHAVRAAWNIPDGPIPNLVQTLERAGCLVVPKTFPSSKIFAVSWWVPGMPPVMFVSEQMPGDRMRHTLAHELGHLILHNVPNPDMEREADLFAGAFLVPRDEIRAQMGRVTLRELAKLKPYWKVAMQALLMRAKQVGKVSDNQARYLFIQMGQNGYRRREPRELDVPREEPSLLQDLIRIHHDELGLSSKELAGVLLMQEAEAVARYGVRQSRPLRLVKEADVDSQQH